MSILEQKRGVFGKIAADKTLTQSMPKVKLTSSFPSINNNGNVVTFLCDLIKSLFGYDGLVEVVTNTLTHELKNIEADIKNALKDELKSIISCNINPSLPDFIKSTGNGVKVTVNKIDFKDMFKTDPNTEEGKLIFYDQTPNLIDSTDFNTFMYQTIQSGGQTQTWGLSTLNQGVLSFNFRLNDPAGIDPNNTITIKTDPSFDNKTLSELNNSYIDSIVIFNTADVITKIIDSVFGTVAKSTKKTTDQIVKDEKINTIINKLSNTDAKDVISDKYFDFTDSENKQIQNTAALKKRGQSILDTTTKAYTTIPDNIIKSINKSFSGLTNQVQISDNIKKTIDKVSDIATAQSTQLSNQINNKFNSFSTGRTANLVNKQAIKLNFVQQVISNLTAVLVNSVLSPKIVTIILINYKIVYGENATFDNPIDFLKKNKNLIFNITKSVSLAIIKTLLKKSLKEVSKLIAEALITKNKEKNRLNLAQLLSLLGVPQSTIRQLNGLS